MVSWRIVEQPCGEYAPRTSRHESWTVSPDNQKMPGEREDNETARTDGKHGATFVVRPCVVGYECAYGWSGGVNAGDLQEKRAI